MTFQQLLDGVEVLAQAGDAEVSGVEYDSRRVRPGCLFVALQGGSSDGNKFISAALAAGAVAVVSDEPNYAPTAGIAWARVAHGRRALARLSANFYRRPAEKLAITGITGTNGKSTTAFLIESILKAAGRSAALVGTIEYHVAGKTLPAPHTTPESLELNRMFAEARQAGATEAVMEVSSHALAQERTFGIPFDVAVFTNLTRDHLDYHHTFEEYFAAKQKLFEGCGTDPPRVAVLNLEDEYSARLVPLSRKMKSQVVGYGLVQGEFCARDLEITPRGSRFRMITPLGELPVFSPLIGKVNVYNVLAAAAAAWGRGCNGDTITQGVGELTRVPGRFELVDCGQPFIVVVDYAHTDDALRNLTGLARDFVSRGPRKARVITLFGCGGDRDRAKRPLMGEAAGLGSDFVVLTSDNPRSEDPLIIINDALIGLQRTETRYVTEAYRRKAILLALGEARAGDIVLLAGKGHEKVQVTRAGSAPFDDVQEARSALVKLGYCEETEPVSRAAGGKP
ncbi:MAG TPA: UDP-N-acetylmuramoyl-L-alanyl-D-glutamate--2,6-diaminopimelate ligase [Terriglobales bacterium]|nr:UDP-N-acetylmuramoyl-L-alanyl-D-glutamate--2,6-diaminopimelate ligase [Terriglobales bacterium]